MKTKAKPRRYTKRWTPKDALRIFLTSHDGHRMQAELAGAIVGYVDFCFCEDGSKYPHARNAEIDFVYVSPQFRRQGIARKLLERVLSYLQARGVVWVGLWLGKEAVQDKSYPLYEDLGFWCTCTLPDYYAKGIETRMYVKRLDGR